LLGAMFQKASYYGRFDQLKQGFITRDELD